MNAQGGSGFDARKALDRLTSEELWGLLSLFPPPAACRILHVMLQAVDDLALPAPFKARRDRQVLANARQLGIVSSPAKERSFLARHYRLQTLRQAEELLCLFGSVDAQVRWAEATFQVRGLKHVREAAASGRGAVVISAHLGPMVYYIPILVYYLSKAGPIATDVQVPEVVAVMNAPAGDRERLLSRQVERFVPFHRARFSLIGKEPGGELTVWRELDRALRRGALVLMQLDVVSGGRNQHPLPVAGRLLRLPGAWGAVRLAERHRVPIVPAVTRRTRRGGIGLHVEEPVFVEDSGRGGPVGEATPAQRAARCLAALLERWVFRDPADWGLLPNLHILLAEGGETQP